MSADDKTKHEKAQSALEIIKKITDGGKDIDVEMAKVIKQYLDSDK